mgnify:CR=1 FL=1
MEKAEAVAVLTILKDQMELAQTKQEVLAVLSKAGKAVGYKPAFRVLVAGEEPDKAVRWST